MSVEQPGDFPWMLLPEDRRKELQREQRGIASATSGAAVPSPWSLVTEDEREKLTNKLRGLLSATSGGGDFSDLYRP